MPLLNMSYFTNGLYELVKLPSELIQKLVHIFLACPEERVILKAPQNVIQSNVVECTQCLMKVKEGNYYYQENKGMTYLIILN